MPRPRRISLDLWYAIGVLALAFSGCAVVSLISAGWAREQGSPAVHWSPSGYRESWWLAVPVLGFGWLAWHALRQRGPVAGACEKCGYDLTGNVSGRCPECGTRVPQDQDGGE